MARWSARVLVMFGVPCMTLATQVGSGELGMFAITTLAGGVVLGVVAREPQPRNLYEALGRAER